MKSKRFFYVFLFILLTALCIMVKYQDNFYTLLDIKSPSEFIVDFNHNGTYDNGEEVKLAGIKPLPDIRDNLTGEKLFIFNQLAKNFAIEFFFNKKVQYIGNNDFLVDGNSYVSGFNNSGFNYMAAPEHYRKKIEYIKSNKFYIVNLHNLKYHEIGCRFALKPEKYRIYAQSELPLKSLPCGFCIQKQDIYIETPNNITTFKSVYDFKNFKLCFTDHTTRLKPDKTCSSSICKELVRCINSSKESIDMAVYGYREVPELEMALKSAISRGVKIRMVYDLDKNGSTYYEDTKRLASLIKNVASDYNSNSEYRSTKYSNIIMHNKFFIFDGKYVFTGSANISPSDMSGFNSNANILIKSSQIAQIYKNEFEKMFSSKFHNQKTKTTNNTGLLEGTISVYFSPMDRITQNYIIPLIKSSEKSILISAFLITDKWLADELISAKNRGVEVRIILDALNAHSRYSCIKKLREAGIPVKAENYAGKLHSKTIVIDDKIIVTGSMNFSMSGQNLNDENVIIINNSEPAKIYHENFDYLWYRIDNSWLKNIPRAEGRDSIGSCKDGVDNNYDGLIDSADAGCK